MYSLGFKRDLIILVLCINTYFYKYFARLLNLFHKNPLLLL